MREAARVAPPDPDLTLRQAAVARARELAQIYDDLVPLDRLREGFEHDGRRVSFGSFYKGIHRSTAQRGPAALTLTTSLKDPYADAFDTAGGSFTYAYRAGAIDQADNRALRAAFELQTPLVYFRALAPGQYLVVAPMFVTADDPAARMVVLEPGLPVQDMQPGGLVSGTDVRAYATREARYRLHQQRFKLDVMRAYRHRCAICTLRERELVQAAHIVPDSRDRRRRRRRQRPRPLRDPSPRVRPQPARHRPRGRRPHRRPAAARDRRADAPDRPAGLPRRAIAMPRRPQDRPDPHRLELRFERFASGRLRWHPAGAREAAAAHVEIFCANQIPQHAKDEVRLEHSVRGGSITIVERRAPWKPEYGPEWSSLKVAQLRYDEGTRTLVAVLARPERALAPVPIRAAGAAWVRCSPRSPRTRTGIFWGCRSTARSGARFGRAPTEAEHEPLRRGRGGPRPREDPECAAQDVGLDEAWRPRRLRVLDVSFSPANKLGEDHVVAFHAVGDGMAPGYRGLDVHPDEPVQSIRRAPSRSSAPRHVRSSRRVLEPGAVAEGAIDEVRLRGIGRADTCRLPSTRATPPADRRSRHGSPGCR